VTAAAASRSSAAGLWLAGAIGGAWLALHLFGIFFWAWDRASVALILAAVLAQAWLSTGLFIIAHDAMHGSLAPGRPGLNRAIGTAALAAYAGLSYRQLHPKHHAHHRAPGTIDDPDFHPGAPRRLIPWFFRFFRGYYTHGQILRITVVALLYLALGATLPSIVIFWAVPAVLALGQLFLFGTFLPHRHTPEPFADHHHARSTRLSAVASLLTCFHFGGYHHEHHLSPGTPWWRLPQVRRATKRTAP
jgi:beta-carotene ketolase (CrtW type)